MTAAARTEPAADRALDPADAVLALFAQQARALEACGYGAQLRAILDGIVPPAATVPAPHAAVVQAALERLAAAAVPAALAAPVRPSPQAAPALTALDWSTIRAALPVSLKAYAARLIVNAQIKALKP